MSDHISTAPSSAPTSPSAPDDLPWRLSYDRASVDAHLAEVEVERARLQTQIQAARNRLDGIQRGAEARRMAAMSELGERVVAARADLTRIEQEHDRIVATIRDAATIEAARVLAAAHREAEAMRRSTASLATLTEPAAYPVAPVELVDDEPAARPEADGRADAG